jgi:hypothetical protein
MTRAEVVAAIAKAATPEQLEEFQMRIDSHQETIDAEIETYGSTEEKPFDYLDVLIDYINFSESYAFSSAQAITEMDKKDRKAARKELKSLERMLVIIGFYKPVTDEVAKEACRNGIGVRMSNFPVIDGRRYESTQSYSQFIESLT